MVQADIVQFPDSKNTTPDPAARIQELVDKLVDESVKFSEGDLTKQDILDAEDLMAEIHKSAEEQVAEEEAARLAAEEKARQAKLAEEEAAAKKKRAALDAVMARIRQGRQEKKEAEIAAEDEPPQAANSVVDVESPNTQPVPAEVPATTAKKVKHVVHPNNVYIQWKITYQDDNNVLPVVSEKADWAILFQRTADGNITIREVAGITPIAQGYTLSSRNWGNAPYQVQKHLVDERFVPTGIKLQPIPKKPVTHQVVAPVAANNGATTKQEDQKPRTWYKKPDVSKCLLDW